MAAARRVMELEFTEEELANLERSRARERNRRAPCSGRASCWVIAKLRGSRFWR